MRRLRLLLALFLFACASIPKQPADPSAAALFDQAEAASTGRNLGKARDLYIQAAEQDSDPHRRDRAAIEAAMLAWHVFHEPDAARALFDRVADTSRDASAAWSGRARMETELTRDFDAARAAAAKALALARTLADRESAVLREADATITQARLERLAGRCPADRQALEGARTRLLAHIEQNGPVLESSRLLLDAALLTGDEPAILLAWRWYYADIPQLVPAAAGDRRTLGLALAAARLFPQAELVLRDPCVNDPPSDAEARDIVTYAAALRRIEAVTNEHYRAVGRGVEDRNAYQQAVGAEAAALWNALSRTGERPKFSLEAVQAELGRRFGTVVSLGSTDDIFGLLLGHKVIDESRTVEQYGHQAPLRFVSLDGMVSGGYMTWAKLGARGTGGWIGKDAIYQIRPMYANDPTGRWRRIDDPVLRARRDEEIAEETKRDQERARVAPIAYFRGLNLRLQRQADVALRAELERQGLSGPALRDAFLAAARRDEFDSSIWAHEGRHAIDKTIFRIESSPELEFRAKISEVVLSRTPRAYLGAILSPVGPPTAHGVANQRLLEGVAAWMQGHAAEIEGVDPRGPMIPQLDKLTDEQLRAAFGSLDPLRTR